MEEEGVSILWKVASRGTKDITSVVNQEQRMIKIVVSVVENCCGQHDSRGGGNLSTIINSCHSEDHYFFCSLIKGEDFKSDLIGRKSQGPIPSCFTVNFWQKTWGNFSAPIFLLNRGPVKGLLRPSIREKQLEIGGSECRK